MTLVVKAGDIITFKRRCMLPIGSCISGESGMRSLLIENNDVGLVLGAQYYDGTWCWQDVLVCGIVCHMIASSHEKSKHYHHVEVVSK